MVTAKTDIAPWLVEAKDFPENGTRKDQMRFLLRYAVLAPSFFNSQPWKFEINEKTEEINVYVNKANWFKVADPEKRELYLSIGCALENLLVAVDYFQLGHQTAYFPDTSSDEWVANIRIVGADRSLGPRSRELFSAITDRRTNYHTYDKKPLSSEHIDRIEKFLTEIEYRVYLTISNDPDVKTEVDQLISHGKAGFFSNKNFRQELRQWLDRGDSSKHWFVDKGETLDNLDANLAEKFADKEQEIINSAPAIAVLSSRYNNPVSWVKVGQTFERIGLEATLLGIRVHPMYQLMEIPELQEHLERLFPDMEGYPQMIFALGYTAQEKQLTPRKSVEEVLV